MSEPTNLPPKVARRVDWIDIAKGISIALVTWHHTIQYGGAKGLDVGPFETLNYFLAPIRMPLFFAVAGIFAMKAVSRSWSELLRSRVATMLWLLLCWSALRWLTFHFLVTNPVSAKDGTDPLDIPLALTGPDNGIWFLWSLALFFILTKLSLQLPLRLVMPGLVLLSIWAGGYLFDHEWLAGHPWLQNLAHRNSIRYFLFFWFAASFPQVLMRAGAIKAGWLILLLPGAAILSWASSHVPTAMLSGLVRFMATLGGVTALFIASRLIRPTPLGPSMKYLGRNTLAIYVAQIPLLCILLALLPDALIDAPMPLAISLLMAIFVIVTALALALREGLERLGASWLYALPEMPLRQRAQVAAIPSTGSDRLDP